MGLRAGVVCSSPAVFPPELPPVSHRTARRAQPLRRGEQFSARLRAGAHPAPRSQTQASLAGHRRMSVRDPTNDGTAEPTCAVLCLDGVC